MAKMQGSFKFDVTGLDKVKTLVDLLFKHEKDLPEELVESLHDLADCEDCEWDSKRLMSIYPGGETAICKVDGQIVQGVVSANPILKRLTVHPAKFYSDEPSEIKNGVLVEAYKYPKSFLIEDNYGNKILGW
jgi:hypothetical protein